jgi:Condensation domain
MANLTLLNRRYVKFCGERAVEQFCTLGQLNTMEWIGDDARAGMYRQTEWSTGVPEGTTLDDMAEVLAVLMARHESLRTTCFTDGEPVQRVEGSGELAFDVYETDARDRAEYDQVLGEMASRLRPIPFDPARQLPLRAAVLVRGDAVHIALIACTHIAVDCESMTLIMRQFRQLISDPAGRVVGPLGHQPVDQAIAERSELGQRRAEAALRYWRRHLLHMPQSLYAAPVPGADAAPCGHAVLSAGGTRRSARAGWLRSRAVKLALPHVAARTRVTVPMVIVSALCAVLARRTGHRDLVFAMTMSNRIGQHLHEYVGCLAQDTLLAVDTEAISFDELTRRVGTATLKAARHGIHSVQRRIEIQQDIGHQRGTHYYRDCWINMSMPDGGQPTPDGPATEARDALPETSVRWEALQISDVLLLLRVMELDGEPQIGLITADPAVIPAGEVEALLRAMERLIVTAAADDVDLRQVGEITGIAPLERGPGWLRVDSCWVELPEVQRLADEALAGSTARVFAVPDAAGRPRLVAYLTARGDLRTPWGAHSACMALLPGRHTAMTPAYYVVCDRAPDDHGDVAAWQRQRVLAQGTGR